MIARFDRLYIPKETEDKFKHLIDTVPAEDLPSMDIRIQKLTVENINLGKVSLNATATNGPRNAHLWKLNQLTAQNDAATLTANGQWRRAENENMTKLKGELKCTDGAKFLKSLSLPDGVVRGAAGTIELSLQWPGAPQEFTTRKLDGVLQADIGAGQILQAEPGVAGRFLSLISMQSLLKRLTLDFKDVFGKGYAFDNFRFKGNISNGVLETHDALVEGSAASVAIEGQTDLSAQTVRGKALVLPNISAEAGALALGIAIANPLAGLGGFLAQFVLKHPLSRLLATEYKVEGNWGNVEIEKKQTYNLNQSTEQ